MLDSSVKREKYWSRSLTGNNVKKYLENVEKIFTKFFSLVDEHFHTFPLRDKMELYKDLFILFRVAYKSVNHSRVVNDQDCVEAQAAIDRYMSFVHDKFKWKTTTNKCHYLQERAVAQMKERGVGLAQFSEQGKT